MLDFKDFLNSIDANIGYEINIDYRDNDPVINDLVVLISKMKGVNPNSSRARDLRRELGNLIYDRFGIPVDVERGEFSCLPLAAYDNVLSQFNKDDAIMTANISKAMSKYIDKVEKLKEINFEVDLKEVRIIGLEKDLESILMIPDDIFYGGKIAKKLTDREIAAVILHEVGHMFTFLYYMSRTVKNSVTLVDSLMLYANGDSQQAKKVLIQNTTDKPVKIDDNKMVIQNVLDSIDKDLKAFGNYIFILESKKDVVHDSETEADSFAVRFGLGKELASALDKMIVNKSITSMIINTTVGIFIAHLLYGLLVMLVLFAIVTAMAPVSVAGATAGLTGAVVGTALGYVVMNALVFAGIFITIMFIVGLIVFLFNVITGGDISFEYEKLHNRVTRMKRELIKVLRTSNLSDKAKKKLISDIDDIDDIVKKLTSDDRTVSLLNNLIPNGNLGREFDLKYISDLILDKLQNNDLHYLAEKLNLKIK
jgi:hypothetical protein